MKYKSETIYFDPLIWDKLPNLSQAAAYIGVSRSYLSKLKHDKEVASLATYQKLQEFIAKLDNPTLRGGDDD